MGHKNQKSNPDQTILTKVYLLTMPVTRIFSIGTRIDTIRVRTATNFSTHADTRNNCCYSNQLERVEVWGLAGIDLKKVGMPKYNFFSYKT